MNDPSLLKVWLITANAPGVDKDMRDLRALFTAGLHPEHRALPTNIAVVRNGAGTLLEQDVLDAFDEMARWDGMRFVWIAGHGEPRALGVPFLRTDDRHHGGCLTIDGIWSALSHTAATGRPLLALLDLCHAAPNDLLGRHLDDNLIAIAASQRGQHARGTEQDGGWLTQSFIRCLTSPEARRAEGKISVADLLAGLWSEREVKQMAGQTPFVHSKLNGMVLNRCPVAVAAAVPTLAAAVDPGVAAVAAWRRRTAADHRDLMPFFRRGGDRLLDAVYVELCLDGEAMTSGDGIDDIDGITRRSLHASALSLRELMASRGGVGRWLVLGEPGAGKSTIARHLAATLANEPGDPVVPVYLPLARLASSDRHPFAEADAILGDDEGVAGLNRALRARGRGLVWLLLDGLDEVAEEHRTPLLERLRRWSESLPDVAIAVFGRPFREVKLPGFERATVRPLDRDQQRRLLGGWLNETEAALTAATIAGHPRLVGLAGNPLLLSLMALLTGEGKGLPPTRGALYREAVGLLIDKPRDYGRSGGLSHPAAARRLLGAVSVALHQYPGESWDEADVLAAVAAAGLDEALRGDLAAYGSPENLLAELARGGGVLGPFEGRQGRWRYLHRSLREYLAAEYLAARPSRLQAVLDEVGEAKNPDHWGVVLGLCCALAPKPLVVLALVRAASVKLALWALPEVELAPVVGLGFFERVVGAADPAAYGEYLRRLVAGFGEREAAAAAVLARVGPGVAVERLAVMHYALSAAGVAVDDEAFFARAGRPMPAGAVLVPIEGGVFTMGSPPDELGRSDNELAHRVWVSGFELGAMPVTKGEYTRFDGGHKCDGGPRHPVTEVSWYAARLYAAWVGCVLPSEAEWEYACRAGSETRYWSGDEKAGLSRVAWYGGNTKDPNPVQPVGGKPANRWGLKDMHGNVAEWCGDWYGPYEPAEARDPGGPPAGVHRVIRGGTAWDYAHKARSAYRSGRSPDCRYDFLGFRLARRPPSTGT